MSSKGDSVNKEPAVVKYLSPFPLTGPEVTFDGHTYQLATLQDCLVFRNYADSLEGFQLRYSQYNDMMVWDKKVPGEAMNVVKVFGVFHDVTPHVLYDMLHDPIYREVWDHHRLHACRVVKMNENNDIGYYAAKSPLPPIANREFLNQRAWVSAGDGEYVIFNTTVPHRAVPVDFLKLNKISSESVVRGVSKVTGYLIRPWASPDGRTGCSLTYISQCDPCGWIPSSFINFFSTKLAPNTIKVFRQAVEKYSEWILTQDNYAKDWPDAVEPYGVPVEHRTIQFAKEKWGEEEKIQNAKKAKKASKK